MKPVPSGKHTLPGACHCKAVQYTASNVDLTVVTKCNCTLCQSKNRIGIMLGNNDITLSLSDGSQKVINYSNVQTEAPPELATYVAGLRKDGGKVNMHFCSKCGVDLFDTESIPGMPENFVNVNLMALDLSPLGLSYKDVTHPEVSTYVNGLDDSWERREGEPFENGSW